MHFDKSILQNEVKKYLKPLLFLLIVFGLLVFFTKAVVILLFLGLNVLTALAWYYWQNRSIGIEFVFLTAVVSLFAFGFKPALFVLVTSLILHMVLTTHITLNSVLTV